MNLKVANLPVTERPRERFKELGSKALSNIELIAVLLGSGSKRDPVLKMAHELMMRFGSIKNLSEASLEELQLVSGIGLAKALTIKAAFSLAERSLREEKRNFGEIRDSEQAFKIALPYILKEKREFFLSILLDVRHQLIDVELISIGTVSSTLVHPREFFLSAIKRNASSMIAVHNHPSGNLKPSKADIDLTKQLIEASKLVEIPLLDHLIIGTKGYYSLRENGFLFNSTQ